MSRNEKGNSEFLFGWNDPSHPKGALDKLNSIISLLDNIHIGLPHKTFLPQQPNENHPTDYFLSILDTIDQIVYVVDPDTHEILFINRNLQKQFGNILGKKCYQALQNLDAPCSFCTNKHIFGKNLGTTYIWDIQNKANQRWYHCIDRAVQWFDGRWVRYEIAIDITQQKKTLEELYRYGERYRRLVELSTNGILIHCDEKIVFVNPAGAKILGAENPESLIGRHILDFIHPESHAACKERIRTVLEEHRSLAPFENKFVRLDSTFVHAEIVCIPFSHRKKPAVQVVFQDITQRKRAEERMMKLNECLLQFGPNPLDNINKLVALCGQVFLGSSALYNRVIKGFLCSIGYWNVPPDFIFVDDLEGHVCADVISGKSKEVCVIRHLPTTKYAVTDPNVKRYQLETYMGKVVEFNQRRVGVLCTVFKNDFIPTDEDKRFVELVASAIAIEEERLSIEQRLRMLEKVVEQTSEGVIMTSLEGEIQFVNSSWCAMYGYNEAHEIVGKSVAMFHSSEEEESFDFPSFEELKTKGFLQSEHSHYKKDGTQFPVWVTWTVLKDPNGVPIAFEAHARDITEHKMAERALRESELQYRTTIDSLGDAVHVVDKELRIVLFNQMTQQWNVQFDLEPVMLGKSIFEIYPFLPNRVRDEYEMVFESGQTLVTEEAVKIDGRYVLTETRKIPVFSNKKVIRVITVMRDITERKQAEQNLLIEKNFSESIINSLPGTFFLADVQGRFIRWNKNFEMVMGYSSDEIMQMSPTDFVVAEDRKGLASKILEVLETGKGIFESKALLKNGKSIPYLFTGSRIEINGRPYLVGTGVDISERKKTEQEKEVLNRELSKTNKQLKHLALKDPHTKLYNYRYLEEVIETEFYRAQRYSHPLSVIMIDIDYFKSVNDVYGHHFGDVVLMQFAQQLRKFSRRYDSVIRSGGEEFVILSHGVDKSTAKMLAQNLLEMLRVSHFGNKEHAVKLKLSISVVSFPEDNAHIRHGMELVNFADKVLSKAKKDGGDRVYAFEDIQEGRGGIHEEESKKTNDVEFLRRRLEKLTKTSNQSLMEAIFAFAQTIELKDHYTGEHVEKTVHYAQRIAQAMNIAKEDVELIKQAAMLHDLGKIGISEGILNKPAKLTKKEFSEIKRHPQIGADILRPIHGLQELIPLILHHHERWDAKGYPDGIGGEDIPIGSRIVALADVYQALTSDRPYRKAFSDREALDIIKKEAGAQFDPKVVEVFSSLLESK